MLNKEKSEEFTDSSNIGINGLSKRGFLLKSFHILMCIVNSQEGHIVSSTCKNLTTEPLFN